MEVGTVVILRIGCLGNPQGTLGVCYEEYVLDGRYGYSIIFTNGEYDGFSNDPSEYSEVEEFLHQIGFCPRLSGYDFKNVMKLSMDFSAGVFNPVFVEKDFETYGVV